MTCSTQHQHRHHRSVSSILTTMTSSKLLQQQLRPISEKHTSEDRSNAIQTRLPMMEQRNDSKSYQKHIKCSQIQSVAVRTTSKDVKRLVRASWMPRFFFTVLLGADALEPYVGRLRLTKMFCEESLAAGSNGTGGNLAQQLHSMTAQDKQQVCRQVTLAVQLAEQLDSIASQGSTHGSALESAKTDVQGILGKDVTLQRFIQEIGWVYKNRAQWHLAKLESPLGSLGFRALSSKMRGHGREASQQATTAQLAVRSLFKLRRIISEADNAEQGNHEAGSEAVETEMPAALNSALPTFMETFWSLSSHDITGTLDKVIERVLRDCSIEVAARRQRALALIHLGEALMVEAVAAAESIVHAAGTVECAGTNAEDEQKRRRFEEAFIASVGAGSGRSPQGEAD